MTSTNIKQAFFLQSELIENGYTHLRLCQIVIDDKVSPANYHFLAVKQSDGHECFENGPLIPIDSQVGEQIIFNCFQVEIVIFYEMNGNIKNTKTDKL
jgi:hypothetical protein